MKALGVWLGCLICAVAILSTKLYATYDLGYFLPPAKTSAQHILTDQLGKSPASNLMLIGIKDAEDQLLLTIRDELSKLEEFNLIRSDLDEINLDVIPQPLLDYRFVLQDIDFSTESLSSALTERAIDIQYAGGSEFLNLIALDPLLASISTLEKISLTGTDQGTWVTADGYRILIAETSRPAFDIAAQQLAADSAKAVLENQAGDQKYAMTGVGVFSSDLQQTIQREATLRSIFASLAICLVLWFAYRRFSVLIFAALPLVTGAATGLAAICLLYTQVHGITLAFGFTLLGIAIDYPLHLYSHSRTNPLRDSLENIQHPLITGLLSTVSAYIAISFAGAEGLAQLGVFTAVGLVGAALTTIYLLPALTKFSKHPSVRTTTLTPPPDQDSSTLKLSWHALAVGVVIALIALASYFVLDQKNDGVWNNNLAALSPVPEKSLAQDNQFRNALGTPDLRYLLAIRGDNLQDVLQQTELLDSELESAKSAQMIGGWRVVTSLLPSIQVQQERRSQLPESDELIANLSEASETSGFRLEAFDAFIANVEESKTLPLLTTESYSGTSLQGFIDTVLYESEQGWVSIISLSQPRDLNALSDWLASSRTNAELVDLKTASETLVVDYRVRTLNVLAIALVAVFGLLIWRARPQRAIWCLANVLLGVALTSLVLLSVHSALNLYHMIALVLVAGLGLDYSLFISSEHSDHQAYKDTLHATTACMLSTLTVFTILGASSIPALNALGITVALGSLCCFLLARFGAKIEPQNQESGREAEV